MIEQMIKAWCFIFDKHPDGESIMQQVMDQDCVITFGQFRKWFHEARSV